MENSDFNGRTYADVLVSSFSGNDFNSGHHVLHHGVVHLLADQPLDVALSVDAQEVDQKLDGATLTNKSINFYWRETPSMTPFDVTNHSF
jgi:hypothetical protein